MFTSADQLYALEKHRPNRLHALWFGWEEFEPRLLAYDGETEETVTLGLDTLDAHFSGKRYCVGTFRGDGYAPCPHGTPVSGLSQCPICAAEFVPLQVCVFEPQCDGSRCEGAFCGREHAVYLAFFRDKPKVGMTSAGRVRGRVIEQGADAYSEVARADNRLEARRLEKRLSKELDVTQLLRSRAIARSLAAPLDRGAIERKYDVLARELERLGHSPGPLNFLDGYPLDEPLGGIPRPCNTPGVHMGQVIGVKGRYLVYRNGGSYLLNLQDVPGRYVSF